MSIKKLNIAVVLCLGIFMGSYNVNAENTIQEMKDALTSEELENATPIEQRRTEEVDNYINDLTEDEINNATPITERDENEAQNYENRDKDEDIEYEGTEDTREDLEKSRVKNILEGEGKEELPKTSSKSGIIYTVVGIEMILIALFILTYKKMKESKNDTD